MKLALALSVAFIVGAIPYVIAGAASTKCARCFRGWAVWPIRNHLRQREFVCHRDFTLHRKKIST